jgi:WD40 repeat protein
VDVDWGALNALPPADYILYEGSNDLHALSQDGKVDRTIIHNRLAGRPAAPTALRYAADQPAGERITLTTLPEGPGSVVDLRRRGAAVLPAAHIDSKVFACSPDGRISPNERWAVFVCGPSAQPFLAVKDLDSGQVLTAPNTASEGRPEDYPSFSWSPDSRWIVYTRTTTRRFPKMQGTAELMLIDAGCLDRSFQTCPLQKSGPFALRDKMLSPAPLVTWSPDSQYFALTTWEGSFPILAFNVYARTFNSVEAVDGAHTASGIAWSVDRSWIAFSEGSQVKLIPMGGGRVTTLRGGQTGGEVRVVGWLSTFPRPVFQVGSILFITGAGHQLRLRETPGLQGTLVEVVSAGFSVRIVSGPVQADGYRWWKLKGDADTVSGWAIENSDWYAMKK